MEKANKVMKNYFWAYINYTQDDWVDNLPMAEFAASNHINASTKVMLFLQTIVFTLEPIWSHLAYTRVNENQNF